ncbi:MAG: DNA-3-methyladenine glycosylase [Candidatus Limnocylindrales bacterium]
MRRETLAGPAPNAARSLLGARLVRDDTTGRREGRIVEVEAYDGPSDLASHARFGPTDRNRVMFGPPGIAYVYLVYGMYDCLNVVVGPDGGPSAVLIRSVEPLAGIERMREDRLAVVRRRRAGRTDAGLATARARLAASAPHRLASGPGLVAAAFAIETAWTGADLCVAGARLRLERDPEDPADTAPDEAVIATPRIGVAYAADWASVPWRFALAGHRSVSGPAAARSAATR